MSAVSLKTAKLNTTITPATPGASEREHAPLEQLLVPDGWSRRKLKTKLSPISSQDAEEIQRRVAYYNRLGTAFQITENARKLSEFSPKKQSAYYCEYHTLTLIFHQYLDTKQAFYVKILSFFQN